MSAVTFATADNPFLIAACERKARYPSEQAARRVAHDRLRASVGTARRLWVYPCASCRGWHLTSRENTTVAVTAFEQYEGVGA